MFWVYWDTAWSIILSGIMVATILAHPEAEIRGSHAAACELSVAWARHVTCPGHP